MDVSTMMTGARDALNVRRVFGEPYEKDGVTVIPVARIQGGAGGGGSPSDNGKGEEGGGGYGLSARPVGAYVIREGMVSWVPARDVTRIVIGGQILAGLGLLVFRSLWKQRQKVRKVQVKKGD